MKTIEQRLVDSETKQSGMEVSLSDIRTQLAINTAATKRIETNTAFLVNLFTVADTASHFLAWLGKVAKWITSIAAAALIIWAFSQGKIPKIGVP